MVIIHVFHSFIFHDFHDAFLLFNYERQVIG